MAPPGVVYVTTFNQPLTGGYAFQPAHLGQLGATVHGLELLRTTAGQKRGVMNAMARSHTTLTLEEYLESEKTSEVKHEYVGGELYAFAGASAQHNIVAGNFFTLLKAATRGGPCQVFIGDVKLQVAEDAIYYPDVMVTCDPTDDDPYVKRRPSLVVEVLSPSTWNIDMREKLHAYKQVDGLQAYLIASQDNRDIIHYWRDAEGVWQREDVVHRGTVSLPFLNLEMTLEEIYEGVF